MTWGLKSNNDPSGWVAILPIGEKLTENIQPWMGFEPMPPRYSLGAATNWARKPHVGSEENLRGLISFVEETYALCCEINQIAP